MTLRQRIIRTLTVSLKTATATDLWNWFNCTSMYPPVKLSSIASLLKKMTDAGEVSRVAGYGPRGGYGYSILEKTNVRQSR